MDQARHILVVEDDDAVRESVIDQLEDAGHRVTAVATGAQALQSLREGSGIDLVVFDLGLPVMDGWEFRVQQRGDRKLRHIPVIAISGDASAKAAAVDADAFLQKPFKEAALPREIDRIFQQERHRAEQLSQMERMASLGMVAAGIGHEINNPLAYVLMNLHHAINDLNGEDLTLAKVQNLRDVLREAKEGADRIGSIVRDLRAFVRSGKERREPVDLARAVELAINISCNELRHRGQLVKKLGAAPPVEGDESLLSQVFVNLLVNATHALDQEKRQSNEVRIELYTDETGCAVVEVSDTGKGISPADLPRLFEPFFTTKGEVGGTGLGLALASETIKKYNGDIQVTTEVGKGSTFKVVLPPWREPLSTEGASEPVAVSQPPRGRVLVIDDEASLAKALAWSLGRDHDVKTAGSAQEALQVLEEQADFDVILCDLMMPGMNGMDLFYRLREMDTALAERMVFMTGGAFSPRARDFLDEVKAPRLDKPFEPERLRALISARVAARR